MPKETHDICQLFFDGNVQASAKLQLDLLPLINQLFVEVNPIPVKAACAAMGYCDNYLRLPLTPMEAPHAAKLYERMHAAGIRF